MAPVQVSQPADTGIQSLGGVSDLQNLVLTEVSGFKPLCVAISSVGNGKCNREFLGNVHEMNEEAREGLKMQEERLRGKEAECAWKSVVKKSTTMHSVQLFLCISPLYSKHNMYFIIKAGK